MIKKIGEQHSTNHYGLEINQRIILLKKLKQAIIKHETGILDALYQDLHKSKKEAYLCEINEVINEIEYHIKHIKSWTKDKVVKNTYQTFGCKSFIHHKPKGKVLIIVPFNYPFNLTMMPLIGAISAGNNVLIKTSSLTQHTAQIIKTIINETFDKAHIDVIDNSKIKNYDQIFDYQPDLVFFTGSTNVGQKIHQKCVASNIECIMELGGQCPCIVYDDTNKATYNRIIWAKFLNAGQTCVSINHILYNPKINDFKAKLIEAIKIQYPDTLKNQNIPKIINESNFNRLTQIIKEQKKHIVYGGQSDAKNLIIEPTIIEVDDFKQIKKYDEVFGPILFIIKVDGELSNLVDVANKIDNSPLAAYLYSSNNQIQTQFINQINAGGYCINDSITHILNHHLPFGGVKTSGTGAYHGKHSFDIMSYAKPVVINKLNKDIQIKFINNDIDLKKTKSLINKIKKIIK